MCGICGFVDITNRYNVKSREKIISEMTDTLVHRGPDDKGYWHNHSMGLSLGHRRLSIMDLSSNGDQPMRSNSGRYIMVFNGEIYNHTALRQELQNSGLSVNWRGHSDTETLLAWAFARKISTVFQTVD